jgi:hypothetical protein
MKKILLAAWLLVGSIGCTTVDQDVVDSIQVLRDNTAALGERYKALIQRSGPVEGQTAEDWGQHVLHENTLIDANKTLADQVLTWANTNNSDAQ